VWWRVRPTALVSEAFCWSNVAGIIRSNGAWSAVVNATMLLYYGGLPKSIPSSTDPRTVLARDVTKRCARRLARDVERAHLRLEPADNSQSSAANDALLLSKTKRSCAGAVLGRPY